MSIFVSAEGDVFANHSDIRRAYPGVSLPHTIGANAAAHLGLTEIAEPEKPDYDTTSQRLRLSAAKIGGQWSGAWRLESLPAGEIARKAAETVVDVRSSEIKASIVDDFPFLGLSKKQIRDHVMESVNTMADAREALTGLSMVCSLLISHLFEE